MNGGRLVLNDEEALMLLATSTLHPTMAGFAGLGAPEAIIIVLVLLLLFGGRKLPEVARGTGRALRIFKAETKGLMDDDDSDTTVTTRTNLPPGSGATVAPPPERNPATTEPLPPTSTET